MDLDPHARGRQRGDRRAGASRARRSVHDRADDGQRLDAAGSRASPVQASLPDRAARRALVSDRHQLERRLPRRFVERHRAGRVGAAWKRRADQDGRLHPQGVVRGGPAGADAHSVRCPIDPSGGRWRRPVRQFLVPGQAVGFASTSGPPRPRPRLQPIRPHPGRRGGARSAASSVTFPDGPLATAQIISSATAENESARFRLGAGRTNQPTLDRRSRRRGRQARRDWSPWHRPSHRRQP